MDFSLKLKELREKKHLTQKQLAIELGVAVGSVGMWESSERIPPAKRLQAIANYFGVTVDELLGYDELTPEERAEGARETIKRSITPMEDDLLYAFRQVGKKLGEKGQRSVIDLVENIAGIK